MKLNLTMAAGIAAALGLGLAAAVSAHGPMGGGGPGFFRGDGTGYACPQGTGTCVGAGPLAQLFTTEERTAFQEQMRAATTVEQRQALMDAHRAEIQRRAAEKGITLPDRPGYGPGAGMRGWMHN